MSGQPPGGFPPPPGEQGWGPPPSPGGWPAPPGSGSGGPAAPSPGQAPGQGPWQPQPPGQWGWQPQPYGGPATRFMPKAGFWARFASLFLDGLILSPPGIIGWIVLLAGPKTEETCSVDSSGDIVVGGETNAICEVPSGAAWAIFALMIVLSLGLTLAYIGILMGKRGATWGQQALGIQTVDQYTAQPIGPGRAIGRYFAAVLSAIPCYLGYFWALWDEDRQTWHDKIVGSAVVQS